MSCLVIMDKLKTAYENLKLADKRDGCTTLRRQVAYISCAEVGSFIHVNPEAIIGGQLMEGLQLLSPIPHPSLA